MATADGTSNGLSARPFIAGHTDGEVLAIATIVTIVIANSAEKLLTSGLTIIIVVILHNLCGITVGYSIGRLLRLTIPKRKALSIEVGMQNSGLASSLATLHFAAYPLAIIPGAIFSVWHNISGAIVAKVYSYITEPNNTANANL